MARVLVVDDENLMRTMVEVACRRLGHEALCAATLAEGRRLAATGVDVILLDMLLPDGNGLDAQQELAALPDAPDIVVITGHGDGDAAEKALRGGVWDFLMKPVRVRDVEETLSHVLEARDRRRSRRGLELEPGQVAGSGPAMQAALDTGYGIVMPSVEDLNLEDPEIVRQGGRYSVRMKASAPSVHMIRADIATTVSPIVGNEKQSEDMVNYLLQEFEGDTSKLWQSNIFGRSFNEIVGDDLQAKLRRMPTDSQKKMREALERIINEGSGGLICIIL